MTSNSRDGESTTTVDRESPASAALDDEQSDARPDRSSDEPRAGSTVDAAAESFVDLERDLRAFRGEADRVRGQAVDARRLPASEVPADYPLSPTTSEVLELQVRPQGSETDPQPVYFAWPPGEEGPLATLLALRNVDPGSFADLHGEAVPLSVEGEWLVPDLPATEPRGSERGVFGIWASFAILAGAIALSPLVGPNLVGTVWAAVTLFVLPVSTYYDAWYLRTHTDWDGGPLFWTTLSFLPFLNVLVALAYLARRRSAEPV